MPRMLAATLLLTLFACLFFATDVDAAEKAKKWSLGEIKLPDPPRHPLLAATPEELVRVRAAYKSNGPERKPVAAWVEKAGKAMAAKLEFPPRGGQHNQWYQCEKCQMGLVTAEAGHQCPRCKKVYTGAPYDDVIFAKEHGRNLHRALACAWAYAITEDMKYAKDAAAVLLGYAERYEKYPYHDNRCNVGEKASRNGGHLNEQTLGEASYMARYIAPAYDLIHATLNDAERKQIRGGLIEPMLKNIDKHPAGKSNWQTWHNAAMLTGGIALDHAGWVKKALTQAGNGFVSQMQTSVTADGMWFENSWGYHFYTLSAMVEIAEGARRIGLDVWSHPNMEKMCRLPCYYQLLLDGSLPRFGDDVNTTVSSFGRWEAAYNAYYRNVDAVSTRGAIRSMLPRELTWECVLFGHNGEHPGLTPVWVSHVFKSAGHVILHCHGEAHISAALTFGPFGGFHGHFDKLSFVSAAFGEELGYDPGRAKSQAYRLPIHGNWYRATLAHNTVVVDQKSQEGVEGELLGCETGKETYAQIAGARCAKAYKGVAYTRWLAAAPTYLLVFDDLASKDEHTYDWWYHNRGTQAVCEAATKDGGFEKGYSGTEYVQREKCGTSDDLLRVRFEGPKVTNHLTMNAEKGTNIVVGDGVGASVEDRVPLAMLRRSGKTARFAAVLEPVKTGEKPAVTDISWKEEGEAFVVTVKRGTSADRYFIPRPAKADGKAVVRVEVDGKQVQPER